MSDADNTKVHPITKAVGRTINHRTETVEAQKRKLALATGATAQILKSAGQTTDGKSTQADDEELSSMFTTGKLIEPPFDLLSLSLLPEHSSELGQCLLAMEIGVEGWGHRFTPRVDLSSKAITDEVKAEIEAERVRLINFFEYASIDDDFTTFRRKMRRDKESIGGMAFEVIRNAAGEIQGMEHIPSAQVRLGRSENKMREVKVPILELQVDGSVKVTTVSRWKRHRLYLQSRQTRRANLSVQVGRTMVWFKDFQDPRVIDNTTGEEVTDPKKIEKLRAENKLANELVYMRYYTGRTLYGLPVYIGNLLSIYGDRAAEEINFITFRNNNIPSMAVLVSNGQLTDGTIKRIESFVESQIQGSDNYSKFLIIEAESFNEDGEDGGHIKVDIKPLTSSQIADAMFQNYSGNNREAIRRAFRLPPILVGRSDEYTRATAETSRKLADEQIFAPERDVWDNWINRRLFPAMGIRYWKYKSNSPNTTDNTEVVKLLSDAEKTGGMTPRIARTMLEDVLSRELPGFPDDFPVDVPFSLTMAEAVKNKADPAEPGQQLTALKIMKALTDGSSKDETAEEVAEAGSEALRKIMKVRKAVEANWAKMTEDVDKDGEW